MVATLTGNTVGVSTVSGTNIVFSGAPNLTLSGVQGANVATIAFSGGAGAAGNTGFLSAGANTASLGTVEFATGNGITFGLNGQTMTASHNAITSQTNQTGAIYHVGNTTGQSSSSTFDARTLSFRGDGFISVGWSGGTVRISGTQTNPVVSNAIQAVGSATGSGTNTSRFAADDHVHEGVFSVGVTNAGNTAGDTRVGAGRFVFAGGNNITLSQATAANALNTVSIVGPTVPAQFTGGFSTNGNTAGDTGLVTGRLCLAGGNNITLSGSTNAGSITVTISAAAAVAQTNQTLGLYAVGNTTGESSSSTFDARTLSLRGDGFISVGYSNGSIRISGTQTNPVVSNAIQAVGSATGSGTNTSRFAADDHVHEGVFSVGVSNVGNTAGDTRVGPGRFVLAGGNNITLSQATAANALNTISIVGPTVPAQFSGGMSTAGNTAGDTGFVTGRLAIAGGPNITVSGSTNGGSMTISVSGNAPGAAAENNWHHLLGANTSGNTTASGSTIGLSGINLTLSGTNDSRIAISAPATSSLSATGVVSISTNGSTISIGVPATVSLYASSNTFGTSSGTGDYRTLSIAGSGGASIAASNSGFVVYAPPAVTLSFWNNVGRDTSADINTTNLTNSSRSLWVFPLNPNNDVMPGDMTASTARMLISMSASTASVTGQHSVGVSLGIYRISASDSQSTLSLLNSVGSTWTNTTLATSAAANSYSGIRWLSFHSSQWSSNPVFAAGSKYYAALIFSWSGVSFNTLATYGGFNMTTFNASGTFGAASATNTSRGFHAYHGVYTATTAAFPASIHISQLNKQTAAAHWVPYLEFDNLNSVH